MCFLIIIAYGLLIYHFAGFVVWISIIATGLGVLGLSVLLNTYVKQNYGPTSRMAIEEKTDNGNTNWTAIIFRSSVYFLWGLIAVYVMCVCCMYKNIYISIQVLKTASIVIARNFYVLLVPFLA